MRLASTDALASRQALSRNASDDLALVSGSASLGSNHVFTLHEATGIRPRGHMRESEVVRDWPKQWNSRPQDDRHAR